jgi:hypothetical protein
MMRRIWVAAAIVALFAALTAALTWPQAAFLRTHVPPYDDSLLSIWRISWIAHALTSAAPLVNANIFYPEVRTLAYTDAVLLQGLIAAPFIHFGASPVLVYNLLILGSIALSGAAMCLLASHLTASVPAGLVAGTIFAFVTFRFDHFMHLELQATVFLPLAIWFLDRAFTGGRWRDMAGFGACLVLQTLSGIYYTVFLATALAVAIPWRWLTMPAPLRARFARQLVVVGVASGVVAAPYLAIYMQNRSTVGERSDSEVRLYSATPRNYLSSDPSNFLHGGWSESLGRAERRLFPGTAALVLAALGLRHWSSRKMTVLTIGVVGLLLSFGLNTPFYTLLRELVFTYRGLRAPARAAVLVYIAVAVFAAFGWRAVLARRPRWTVAGTAAVIALLSLEYLSVTPNWLVLPTSPPAVARWLSQQPRSVVVEFPLPKAHELYSIHDGMYMYASVFHWQPMLNGYSGFYPRSYIELLEAMRAFPSDEAIAYLAAREVDFVVLHGAHMRPDQLGAWAAALAGRPDMQVVAEFQEARGPDIVFKLVRATPASAARSSRP